MSLDLAAVQTRLRAEIPELRSVESALELAQLMERGVVPQRTPAAFVLSERLTAQPDALLGLGQHCQAITETIAIVAIDRHGNDRTGGRVAGDLVALRGAIIDTLTGWTPDPAHIGPLAIGEATLTGFGGGAGFLHCTFVTNWEYANG